ncbi:hypothetical protein [Afipia carboxidovorans]|uniref:hypothetical protein n=1 Tax=Afipia carboxidovorans TaxID=40137 RepID=UPI0030914B63|nr:hypothetical protein CRBSH125_08830 [Afipia carboxidovorans]
MKLTEAQRSEVEKYVRDYLNDLSQRGNIFFCDPTPEALRSGILTIEFALSPALRWIGPIKTEHKSNPYSRIVAKRSKRRSRRLRAKFFMKISRALAATQCGTHRAPAPRSIG